MLEVEWGSKQLELNPGIPWGFCNKVFGAFASRGIRPLGKTVPSSLFTTPLVPDVVRLFEGNPAPHPKKTHGSFPMDQQTKEWFQKRKRTVWVCGFKVGLPALTAWKTLLDT